MSALSKRRQVAAFHRDAAPTAWGKRGRNLARDARGSDRGSRFAKASQGRTEKKHSARRSRRAGPHASPESFRGSRVCSPCLCVKHPGILAGRREKFKFSTTPKFLRFPNKNPENAILAKSGNATGQYLKHRAAAMDRPCLEDGYCESPEFQARWRQIRKVAAARPMPRSVSVPGSGVEVSLCTIVSTEPLM